MYPPHYRTESVCPLFGDVRSVKARMSYISGENSRFMSCPPVLVCLLLSPQPRNIIPETRFGVSSAILLLKNIS